MIFCSYAPDRAFVYADRAFSWLHIPIRKRIKTADLMRIGGLIMAIGLEQIVPGQLVVRILGKEHLGRGACDLLLDDLGNNLGRNDRAR